MLLKCHVMELMCHTMEIMCHVMEIMCHVAGFLCGAAIIGIAFLSSLLGQTVLQVCTALITLLHPALPLFPADVCLRHASICLLLASSFARVCVLSLIHI